MDDKQLLEAAARAAGLEFHWVKVDGGWLMQASEPGSRSEESWNPLVNDGDALRLAIKCELTVACYFVTQVARAANLHAQVEQPFEGLDEYAATRRAITRAAAACDPHQKGDGQ